MEYDLHLVQQVNHIPSGFFKKISRQGFYPFLQFNEEYINAFKDLPENLFLATLDGSQIESATNQKDPVLFQDNIMSQDTSLQDFIITQDNTFSDNNEFVKNKKEELYFLLEQVKTIIDENTQTPNAEKWINSIDKNFNSLRAMVNDCEQLNRQRK